MRSHLPMTAPSQPPHDLERFFALSVDLLAIASLRTGRWERVSPAVAHVLGWEPSDLEGHPVLDLVHPEDRADAEQALARLAGGQMLRQFEQRLRARDGHYRWIAWQTVPHLDEQRVYCVGRDVTEERGVAERQAHERELLQGIIDSIPVLLVIWDPTLERFTVNREVTSVLGWTSEDANAGDFMARVYPDPAYRAEVTAYMRELRVAWREWVATSRDGRPVPIDWSNVQLTDHTMVGIGVDLRRRKAAEQALRRSEMAQSRHRRFLQTLLDNAGICISVLQGPDLRYSLVNEAQQALRPDVPMAGRLYREVFPEPEAQPTAELIEHVLETGEPHEGAGHPFPVPGKPDARWDHRIVRLPADPEDRPAALVLAWDVTDRVRTHQALARSEQHLRLVLENSRDGIHQLDLGTGRYVYMSPAQERLTGFTIAELAGMDADAAFSRVHPDDREAVRAYLDRVIAGEDPVEPMQYRWRVKSGEHRWFSDSRKLIRDEQGQPRSLVGVSRDITERKEAEAALKRATEDLEQRVVERTGEVRAQADQLRALASQLSQAELRERRRLATVLHDHLQQLIVTARMQLGWLKPDGPPEKLRTTVAGLQAILEDALAASRDLTLDLSPPALHDAGLVGGLEWLATSMQERHGFTVRLRTDPAAEPAVEETRFLLFACVRELLFNALKHAGVREADVELVRTDDQRLELTVLDDGAGFDPSRLHHREAGETTFGLFSIQERLAYIGGRLEVVSAPGRGTRITLYVPQATAAAAETPAEPAGSPPPATTDPDPDRTSGDAPAAGPADPPDRRGPAAAQTCRVLIVDDHRIVREGLRELLESEDDLDVIGEAADGRQAVELARHLAPDVVVMDVNLPGLDGMAATRRIVAERPGVRVVALSMHTDESVAAGMRRAGASAYLAKGVPAEDLIEAIRVCRE